MNTNLESTFSPKRLARIAGVFYLLVGIFGGFAEGFGDPKMYAAGNAAATTGNVLANPGLVRMIVAAHLLDAIFFVLTAMTLYILLEHVHKSMARAMLVFVAVAVGIITLNAVFQFAALRVAGDGSYAAAFGAAVRVRSCCSCSTSTTTASSLANLLRLVAGAAGVSRLQVRDVPQGARRRPHRGGHQLPGGPARAVPGPRLRRANPRLLGHPAHDRGDLDGRIPAGGWRESREARQGHPCRGVNAAAHGNACCFASVRMRSIVTPFI